MQPLAVLYPVSLDHSCPLRTSGAVSAIGGDTIEIHGQRIRLHGIDAPEAGQPCRAVGIDYRCGQQAALALADKIGQQAVSCQPKDQDRYGRIVAICWLGAEDLGAWIVSRGWALAYRRYSVDYVLHEDTANQGRRGLWRGEFQAPWEWRRGER